METSLKGRVILIADDEPLVALDITLAFEDEGAWVIPSPQRRRSPTCC